MKSQKRKTLFRAAVREMAESAVLSHIGADRLAMIRQDDEHPMFVGLNVGYEGISTGDIDGVQKVKRWAAKVINKLAGRLNFDAPHLFEGHAPAASTRKSLGDVLSGFVETDTDNVPTAFGVAYVAPDEKQRKRIRDGELDACSIEADCLFSIGEDESWYVEDVEKVDGIALANSQLQHPGFERAGVVAVIQELQSGRVEEMDKEELKAEVKKAGLMSLFGAAELRDMISEHPSEIFGTERIEADPVVVKVRENAAKDEIEKRVKAEDRATKAEARQKDLQRDANAGKVSKLITDQLADDAHKKLTDTEKARVTSAVSSREFTAEDEGALKTSVAEAITAELKTLEEYRALYGKKKDDSDDDDIEDAPAEKDAGDGSSEDGGGFLANNALTSQGDIIPPKKEKEAA